LFKIMTQKTTTTTTPTTVVSFEKRIYNLAVAGETKTLEAEYSKVEGDKMNKQFLLDLVLMGAVEGKQTAISEWALAHGATLLFGFTQKPVLSYAGKDKNTRLKMLGGPGEVTKGAFTGLGI